MMKGLEFVSISQRMFYSFFKLAQKIFFIEENIEFSLRTNSIWLYIPEKILSVCVKKLLSIIAKKLQVIFALKILLSNHAICQLVRESHLSIRDNYIQAILKGSEQLAAKSDCLEFENEKLIEVLKTKGKKQNKGKGSNLLGKKDYGLQLFLPSRVQIACNFTHNKGAEKKQQIRNVKQKNQKA